MVKNDSILVSPLALILTAVTASASSSHPSLLLRHVNVVPMTKERVIEDVSLLFETVASPRSGSSIL